MRSEPEVLPNGELFNVATNTWFDPLFQKPFPCPDCPFVFNTGAYGTLLDAGRL